MKKITKYLGIISILSSLTACTTSDTENKTQQVSTKKPLIVYFSMPETTKMTDLTVEESNSTVIIDDKVLGNTQYVANVIQDYTDGTMFRIESQIPYTTDHTALVDLASKEKDENARPALLSPLENLDQYDTVYVGFPIWWSDMPMIMYTFFDTYDFSNKTIIPFCTHGGSGLVNTIDKIKELEPNATVYEPGLSISRDNVENALPDVTAWIDAMSSK